ncbi:hypothetical protein EDC01DRAFT_31314 [Geopyxis carbonaria]|nr:hypothetical protein EDC01DRAFT_31314 [Geopyxis carbonaria]
MKNTSAPSHIFVVRHGARLDAADKDWAATTAEPYDTPLSFGGWQQTRSIGQRIASLLQSEAAKSNPHQPRKRQRIVIHSSPFLRCLQTATSLASGLAQHHHQAVTNAHWVDENGAVRAPNGGDTRFAKPLLRIDAWLAEWMNVDYYTDVTPPPDAAVMVSTAKSEYLRAETSPAPATASTDAFSLTGLSAALTGGFVPPPQPVHAISAKDTIPDGYYAHAKRYVDFDYAWDARRLGDGAELGEEWSSMHRRFRNGYKRLLWHYLDTPASITTALTRWSSGSGAAKHRRAEKHQPQPQPQAVSCEDGNAGGFPTFTLTPSDNPTPPLSDSEDAADDIETIVILVTHGAGCNALIGAMTHQPVLIDIGLGSLTWGSRTLPPPPSSSSSSPSSPPIEPPRRKSDVPEPPLKFTLRLAASTDHARHLPSPPSPPFSPLLGPSATFSLSTSGVCKSTRSASHGNGARPTGLWSPIAASPKLAATTEVAGGGAGGTGAFLGDRAATPRTVVDVETVAPVPAVMEVSGTTGEGVGVRGGGLWAAKGWDRTPKRRWTVGREGCVNIPGSGVDE